MQKATLVWLAGIAATLLTAGVSAGVNHAMEANQRLASLEAQYPEILRRLERIDHKLDELRR